MRTTQWMNVQYPDLEEPAYNFPPCSSELQVVVDEYRQLFSTVPGFTDVASHTIPTANNPPVFIPPHCIAVKFNLNCRRCWIGTSLE